MSAAAAGAVPGASGDPLRRWPRNPVAFVMVALIRAYRVVGAARPSPCRFDPTCSAYGLEAVLVHGAAKGGWLTARRIVSCRPGGRMGWDPVPARRSPSSNVSSTDQTHQCPEGDHGHH